MNISGNLTTLLCNILKQVMALCRTWRVKLAHVHALVHAVNSFPANTYPTQVAASVTAVELC